MELRPIGVVKDNLHNYQMIEIYKDFLEALKGIENFKYFWIIFWLHIAMPFGRDYFRYTINKFAEGGNI